MANTGIGIETVRALGEYMSNSKCKLESLDLSNNQLDDLVFCELAVGISQNYSLTSLAFSKNLITLVAMKMFDSILKYSRVLEELDLSHNKLGDESIQLVAKNIGRNKKLTILKLSHIGISDACCADLAYMLELNSTLKSLDLSGNTIKHPGAKQILQVMLSGKNKVLRHLNLDPIDY
jgi:Leucine-rich repeat (LRR) protein